MSVGVMKDENLKLRDLYMSVGVMKDEKLKLRDLHASHTVLRGGLEHLKIKTSLIDEKFASVMGECVFVNL